MSDEKRRDIEGLGGDDVHYLRLHLEADVARRFKAAEAWIGGERFADELADAVRQKLEEAERERMSRGSFRIDMATGQLIEEG